MSELSGIVSGLSGQLLILQQNNAYLNQQLLLRPDLSAFNSYKTVWNSQIQQMSDLLSRIDNKISIVNNLIFNLTYTVNNNYSLFTGYTGTHS